jgi:hypothetical protein
LLWLALGIGLADEQQVGISALNGQLVFERRVDRGEQLPESCRRGPCPVRMAVRSAAIRVR